MDPLLTVKNLRASLYSGKDLVKIVDGVDLVIYKGQTVGIVGETGAGKSVTAFSILGVLQPLGKGKPLWKIEGEVLYKGKDLMKLSEEEMRKVRGKEIALVTQNPIGSLHPIDFIGHQTGETLEEQQMVEIQKIKKLVTEYLGSVELVDAEKRYYHFRHQFSGGEGQRILLAMALVRNPAILLADEPTSGLDVTVQRQILNLLTAMKKQLNLSILLITHNLGVIAEMCDYVYVMYAGKIAEHADVKAIFQDPLHPFTRGLIATTPRMDQDFFKFEGIPGDPPNPLFPISGCKFHPRCRYAKPFCSEQVPPLVEVGPQHFVACLRVDAVRAGQKD